MPTTPKALSKPAEEFALHCRLNGLSPEREFRFDPQRRWRFDFAFGMPFMVAVEIDGGTWTNGRHTRGAGYEKDCEKLNEATLQGWRVFRFTSGMVSRGEAIRTVLIALGSTEPV